VYEYLICKGTVDEAMLRAILSKIRDIEAVVGTDAETTQMKDVLGGVDPRFKHAAGAADLDVVRAALRAVRDRILGAGAKAPSTGDLIAATVNEDWSDLAEEPT
jgi:hypothetical protein